MSSPKPTSETVIVNPDRYLAKFKPRRNVWKPRGTFTLHARMCPCCLNGKHEYCDTRKRCSCICRIDLVGDLLIQHAQMRLRLVDVDG